MCSLIALLIALEVAVVSSLSEPLANRISRLELALQRERQMAAQRHAFSIATMEFEASIAHAQELYSST